MVRNQGKTDAMLRKVIADLPSHVRFKGETMTRAEATNAWRLHMAAYGSTAWKITVDPETGLTCYDFVELPRAED